MAAIITTHTAKNHPSVPRSLHGPRSMPRICPDAHHQPRAARPNSTATSATRARAAAKTGARPVPSARGRACTGADAITWSGGPGELGRRDPSPPLVGDAEGVDLRARRLGGVEFRRDRVEDTDQPDRLA